MGAHGSFANIAIREEVLWGTVDPGQFQGVNFTSEDMAFNIANKVSNNVRPDRQTTDLVQVGADTSGGFETEFQSGNVDIIMPGVFWDSAWHNVVASDDITFAIETVSGAGGIMTFAGAAASTGTFVVGQVFKIAGSADNNGRFTVKAITTNTVQVEEPLVTESSVTCTLSGSYVQNGISKHSYSIERANNDVSQFFLYKGMVPNTGEFSVEVDNPVMFKVSFVGKDEVLTQTTNSAPVASNAPTTSIINAVSSTQNVKIDGTVVEGCLLQKITASINNKVEGKKGVGILGYCDAKGKSIEVTGTISLYFNDSTYYNKYRNSTAFSISVDFMDAEGTYYNLTLFAAKFDKAPSNVTGKDDDVMLDGSYVAIMGTSGKTIMLSKIPAA